MEHQPALPFLRETLLFLTLVGILIPLLQRFRMNQVLGFLVVGVLVGPYGFGLWVDQWPWLETFTFARGPGVQSLAELGVIFLMFLIGLELSVQRMWSLRHWVFLGGMVQVLLSSFVIGSLAYFFGNSLQVAMVLGLVLSLSSTAVVMQLLSQHRALAKPLGQATFAILMLQDLAVVPLLILVDLLASKSTEGIAQAMSWTALKSVGVVLLIFVIGRRAIRPVFRLFARQHQPEVFMALTLLIALSTAGATAAAGLSLALGAFLAGLLLAETEYRHEVEVTIEPFKGLLMGLFFMSVGMAIDLREVANHPFWIAVSVIGLMAIKTLVSTAVFRAGGMPWGKSLEGGMLLAQGGEFAFIVIGVAATMQLLQPDVAQFMLLVVSLSLMVTPLVAKVGKTLGERLDRLNPSSGAALEEADAPESLAGHMVIAGQGRVGQLLADVFRKQAVPYVAIEHDAQIVSRLAKLGRPVYYGNAARLDLLHKLHTARATALIVTMDQPAAAMHTVKVAREAYPALPIFARSRDERHAHELRAVGATAVVPETLEAGLQLSSFALHTLGLPQGNIAVALQDERESRVRGE
ncbi:MAG: potassium transporter [Burkholderiales bacterium RIFCSPLOWO2_12_FULL_61_40]|nr:MAG: potassium transporter [Burkholderiales bacterium RIFCSPLOWO2_12_FULL_61_40]